MSSNTAKGIKHKGKSSCIDDPWETCDSKSYPGLKFYLNQRTGIKVWNITESEISFAENADKEGPEPQKRPTMNHSNNERICNKQIINNQFSNQLSNLLVNTAPVCSFNILENALNQPPQMQPQQSYTLLPTAVVEAYQRLLPLPNNLQNASLPMSFNTNPNPLQNASLPMSFNTNPNGLQNASMPMSFNTNPNPLQNATLPMAYIQKYNNSQNGILPMAYNTNPNTSQNTDLPMAFNRNQPKLNHPMSRLMSGSSRQSNYKWRRNNEYGHTHDQKRQERHVDLRRKLVRQRNLNETYIGNNVIINEPKETIRKEKTWNGPNWEDTAVQMSLTPLKLLTSPDSDSDQWYIVVDTGVILNNYNYINDMATADPDCHLLVPQHAMSELQSHVLQSSNVQARRILRFLTQQIETGLVVLGDKVTGESAFDMTIRTCTNLVSQNTHVVLVSNDPKIGNYKFISKKFHVFTMQEIKDILANRPVKIPRANSPTLAIKIVVPNNCEESNRATQEVNEPPVTFDATERARDTSGITPRKMFYSAENTRDTNRPTQEIIDSVEWAKDTRDIPGTSSRIIVDSTELTNDTEDIYKTTSNRNTDSTIADHDATYITGMHYQSTMDSTEFANDTRHIPRTPSRSIFDSIECTNDIRDNSESEALSHKTFGLSKQAKDARDVFETNFRVNLNKNKLPNDFQDIPKRSSRRMSDTIECTNDTRDIPEAVSQRMLGSTEQANARDISKYNIRSTVDLTKIANDARGKTEINSQGIFGSIKLTDKVRDISETTCQRVINSNNAQDISGTPSRRIVDSTELDNDMRTKISNDSWNQNLPKPAIPTKDSTKKTLETQSVDKSETVCYRSLSKSVPETGKDLSDTGGTIEGHRGLKSFDLSSPYSSSASSHISLDTIGVKRIISMKRLKHQPASITSNKSQTSRKSLEFMPQAINPMSCRPSLSRSSCENDKNSEASVVKRKKVVENVIVDETSTSGVISDSSHSERAKNSAQNDVKKVTRRSIFMYEVACQSMEDVLRTRFDEWLFRFVQIMEEVLRVKLQEKLPLDDKKYPAPRDLQEATTCIINKYTNNFNIVNAANNLSFILYKAGDENGKIADNIEPSDYMEMYSYGVFLVETFQDMNAECQDCKKDKIKRKEDKADSCSCYEVNAASESLKKLLYDIHNTNQETFVDPPRDLSMENPNSDTYDFNINTKEECMQDLEELDDPYNDEHEAAIMEPEDMESSYYGEAPSDEHASNSYNLRSQKRKSQSAEGDVSLEETVVEKGTESSFFESLQLHKTFHKNNNGNNLKNGDQQNSQKNKPSINVPEQIQSACKREEKDPTLHNLKIHFSKNESKNATFQSKVVCNFTVNPDIERKVRARLNQKEYEDENNGGDDDTDKQKGIIDKRRTENYHKTCELSSEKQSEANDNFTYYMALIVRSFVDIFDHAKSLCAEYIDAIKKSDVCAVNELHHELQKQYINLCNIHHELNSILSRDIYNMDGNIQTLLKISNQGDKTIPNDEQCLQYRDLMTKCKKTTENYLGSMRRIQKLHRDNNFNKTVM